MPKSFATTYVRSNRTRLGRYEDCPPLLQRYLNHIVNKEGKTIRTANEYYDRLRLFLRYVRFKRENISPMEFNLIVVRNITSEEIVSVDQEMIRSYIDYLRTRKEAESRIISKVSTIRRFYDYLMANETNIFLVENPADTIRMKSPVRRTSPAALSFDDCRTLLDTAKTMQRNPVRNYAIMALLLFSGISEAELRDLNIKDIVEDGETGEYVLNVPGIRARIIPLSFEMMECILSWIEERALLEYVPKREQALFVSSADGYRLTDRAIRKIISTVINLAGLSDRGYSAQTLRNTSAYLFADAGAGPDEIKALLGYRSAVSSHKYIERTRAHLGHLADRTKANRLLKN